MQRPLQSLGRLRTRKLGQSPICHTTRYGVKWVLRPQDTRIARRTSLSLRIIPGNSREAPIGASYPNQHIDYEEFGQGYATRGCVSRETSNRTRTYYRSTTARESRPCESQTSLSRSNFLARFTGTPADSRSQAYTIPGADAIPELIHRWRCRLFSPLGAASYAI